MTETKPCSNCGKWMIKVDSGIIYPTYPVMKKMIWRCYCGHTEEAGTIRLSTNEDEFKKAWQEANKEKDLK